jgi:transcription-repair coupling factor (superfamily II helicase)
MRDLDIRAGNLLGGEQRLPGEIDLKCNKSPDEAIRELKRTSFRDLFKEEIRQQDDFVQDCTIDTDLEILIPDAYVESTAERLSLYTRLDNCRNEEDLKEFHQEMQDRFGKIPLPVEDLFVTVRCRKIAVELGFERMVLKSDTLRCYFVNNPDSPYFESDAFKGILDYVQKRTNKARLKQTGRNFLLIVEDIRSMTVLYELLNDMKEYKNKGIEESKSLL